jgi:hypothetical protein
MGYSRKPRQSVNISPSPAEFSRRGEASAEAEGARYECGNCRKYRTLGRLIQIGRYLRSRLTIPPAKSGVTVLRSRGGTRASYFTGYLRGPRNLPRGAGMSSTTVLGRAMFNLTRSALLEGCVGPSAASWDMTTVVRSYVSDINAGCGAGVPS